jgi:predicted transcriptional regulator
MDVQNLMTREVFFVNEDADLVSAAQLLKDKRISGAPVVNRDGRPVGMVSLADFADPACPEEGIVSSVMDRTIVCIDSSATLREAAELMIQEAEHRLLVLAEGKMVGILCALDVLPGLLRQFPDA